MTVGTLVFDVFGTLVDWRSGVADAFQASGVSDDLYGRSRSDRRLAVVEVVRRDGYAIGLAPARSGHGRVRRSRCRAAPARRVAEELVALRAAVLWRPGISDSQLRFRRARSVPAARPRAVAHFPGSRRRRTRSMS